MSPRLLLYVRGLEDGGSEKRVERLAIGLRAIGFETAVSYSNPWGPAGDRVRAAGIPIFLFHARDFKAATRVIGDWAPDLFHSFTHKDAVDIAAAAAAGVPTIIASRVNLRDWDPARRVLEWERRRNGLTHRFISVSNAAARVLEEIEGVRADEISTIYGGVQVPRDISRCCQSIRRELGIDGERQLLGYVANYRPEKDHDTLLRAFRIILGERPKTHLVCCGVRTDAARERLAALARELEIENNLSLLDSRSDVDSLYRGLDLYVHTSRFEGFSNSILEAMSWGKACVATAAGGTPEAVMHGVTGLLTPVNDAALFAHAVSELLGDAQRLQQFGAAARERVAREFSLDAMVARFADFYRELLALRPHPTTAAAVAR